MTIDQYVEELKNDAERFKKDWLHNATLKPDHYPMEMPPGEWFEQYAAFLSFE